MINGCGVYPHVCLMSSVKLTRDWRLGLEKKITSDWESFQPLESVYKNIRYPQTRLFSWKLKTKKDDVTQKSQLFYHLKSIYPKSTNKQRDLEYSSLEVTSLHPTDHLFGARIGCLKVQTWSKIRVSKTRASLRSWGRFVNWGWGEQKGGRVVHRSPL